MFHDKLFLTVSNGDLAAMTAAARYWRRFGRLFLPRGSQNENTVPDMYRNSRCPRWITVQRVKDFAAERPGVGMIALVQHRRLLPAGRLVFAVLPGGVGIAGALFRAKAAAGVTYLRKGCGRKCRVDQH